jgi:hypothetical protein
MLLPDMSIRQTRPIEHMLRDSVPTDCDCFCNGRPLTAKLPPSMPRRLVDVDSFLKANRLVIREDMTDQSGTYIAVSHRWGGDIPLKTTKQNLGSYLQGIDATQLPQSFKDAIEVTNMLGSRYVWIDALCVVQDDDLDWSDQASQMGSIYANASVTLALHSPARSVEGFLWRMQVSRWLEVSNNRRRKSGLPSLWLKIPPRDDQSPPQAFQNSEIISRAWCLQELWLSPLILHVVEDQFFWGCSHVQVAFPGHDYRTERIPQLFLNSSPSNWYRMIEAYSSCDLSNPGDKLPAIKGIHSQWPALHTQRSHCGHLGVDVRNGLLWHRKSQGGSLVQRRGRAPSWSWASFDGNISFVAIQQQLGFNVVPDFGSLEFDCKCGKTDLRYNHFGCEECHIILSAFVAGGLVCGMPAASGHFAFHLSEPDQVETLYRSSSHLSHGDCVVDGWAVFDQLLVPEEVSFAVISSVQRNRVILGYCVLLLSKEETSPYYRRIGIGCITTLEIVENLERQRVIII